MTTLADTLTASLRQIGQAFLLAYYLPAAILVQIHLQLLLPAWWEMAKITLPDLPSFDMPAVTDFDFGTFAVALLLPLLVGIVFVGLNGVLIRIFEGKYGWLRHGLLYPLTWLERKRCQTRYGQLVELQREYHRVCDLAVDSILVAAQTGTGEQEAAKLLAQIDGLALQINDVFRQIESRERQQRLPHETARVMPTAFGNAFAVAEEYPYERYGMDAVLFWPRLNELLGDNAPNQADRLARQKTSLDLTLNLATVSAIACVEFVVTAWQTQGSLRPTWLIVAVVALVSYLAFYSAAVNAVRKLGQLIMSSFDFRRSLLCDAFKLSQPADLVVEQVMWVQLATFLRRGPPFYFPESRGLNQLQQVRFGDGMIGLSVSRSGAPDGDS